MRKILWALIGIALLSSPLMAAGQLALETVTNPAYVGDVNTLQFDDVRLSFEGNSLKQQTMNTELFGWGNHALAGYLTSYNETDPLFTAWNKSYNDLSDKPTIPTNNNQLINGAGYITGFVETDPLFTAWNKSYNDLSDKPTIPTSAAQISFTPAGTIAATTVQLAIEEAANESGSGSSAAENITLADVAENFGVDNVEAAFIQVVNDLNNNININFDSSVFEVTGTATDANVGIVPGVFILASKFYTSDDCSTVVNPQEGDVCIEY